MGEYLFLNNFMEREKHIYVEYILCVIWYFKENPDLHLLNRLNYLKLVQHFDGHNSNQKKEKEKKKRRYSVYNFL